MKTTNNLILNTDVYKNTHFGFMEPNTTSTFAYIEARKGGEYDKHKFFGLQYFLKKYFTQQITYEMIDEAEKVMKNMVGVFNREGWEYIVRNHDGYLPLRIKAVKEGAVVPEGNALVTVENTDPNCAWLVTYFETALLRAVWYPTTVATRSWVMKNVIYDYHLRTGDVSRVPYIFIDFGARGVSSQESSEIGGLAHLVGASNGAPVTGTDNILAVTAAIDYYDSDINDVIGVSVPASEHSVTTARGIDGEEQFISDAIDVYGGEGKIISLVADSYDMDNFIEIIGTSLKEKIIENGCVITVRPDSGIPEEVVLHTVESLASYYGYIENDKGYKVLHPSVRVIQGDGINLNSLNRIYGNLKSHGWSADNLAVGCGGYLLQQLNRDTLRFAMKASHVVVDGDSRDVFKAPKTDLTKSSKKGRIALVKESDTILTVKEDEVTNSMVELLQVVFENGCLYNEQTLNQIRSVDS